MSGQGGNLATAPINRLPRGLLSLLEIKSFGKTPRELGNIVQPTMDLTEFYVQGAVQYMWFNLVNLSNLSPTFDAFNLVAPQLPLNAAGTCVQVPADEIWLVTLFALYVRYNAVAGDSLQIAPGMKDVTLRFYPFPYRATGATGSVAAESVTGLSLITQPVWIPGGMELCGILLDVRIAANTVVEGQIGLARFKS